MRNKEPIEILFAEDEETDAFFVRQAFEQLEVKTNLHHVVDGQEVISFLKKEGQYEDMPTPHIILLDINMPRKNGHETLVEIKQMAEYKHIPVIMLSSSHDDADVHKSYSNHASAYVPKSTGFDDMVDLMKRVQDFWLMRSALPQGQKGH